MHRSRDLLMRQRTMLLNAMRSHLVEFGIVLLDALPASSKTIFI